MRGERRSLKCLLALAMTAALLGVGAAASAQIPSLPNTPPLPEIPAPVADAVAQAEVTAYPVLFQAASTASPVVTLGGFAFRPGCASLGYAGVVLAIAGPSVPLGLLGFVSPAFIACNAAYSAGPADPYLAEVGSATGPTVGHEYWQAVKTVRPQIDSNVDPTTLQEFCLVISFAPPQSTMPPPTDRINGQMLFC